jgi:predicted metal-binding protein
MNFFMIAFEVELCPSYLLCHLMCHSKACLVSGTTHNKEKKGYIKEKEKKERMKKKVKE